MKLEDGLELIFIKYEFEFLTKELKNVVYEVCSSNKDHYIASTPQIGKMSVNLDAMFSTVAQKWVDLKFDSNNDKYYFFHNYSKLIVHEGIIRFVTDAMAEYYLLNP